MKCKRSSATRASSIQNVILNPSRMTFQTLEVFFRLNLFVFTNIKVALKLSTLICKAHGPSLIASQILNQVLILIQSPLLQGLALESTIEFFTSIVNHKQPGLQYKDIVTLLIKPIKEQNMYQQNQNSNNKNQTNNTNSAFEASMGNNSSNLAVHKQAFYSIAKCIAALTVMNQEEGKAVINQFINDIKVGHFFILFSKLIKN